MRFAFGRCVFSLVFWLLASTLSGCASTYWQNRARDAADIVTVEFNTQAYGVSARLGPVKAGGYYKDPKGRSFGLRGGRAGSYNSAEFTAVFFGADYFSEESLDDLLPAQPVSEEPGEKKQDAAGQKKKKKEPSKKITALRGKEFRARSPFGTHAAAHQTKLLFKQRSAFVGAPYFTQVELSAGLFGGIKIGLNPGELLDFLLGFFTIDIYGDDAPFADPKLRKLLENPYFRSLDKKTQEKILKEMEDFEGLPQ